MWPVKDDDDDEGGRDDDGCGNKNTVCMSDRWNFGEAESLKTRTGERCTEYWK